MHSRKVVMGGCPWHVRGGFHTDCTLCLSTAFVLTHENMEELEKRVKELENKNSSFIEALREHGVISDAVHSVKWVYNSSNNIGVVSCNGCTWNKRVTGDDEFSQALQEHETHRLEQ